MDSHPCDFCGCPLWGRRKYCPECTRLGAAGRARIDLDVKIGIALFVKEMGGDPAPPATTQTSARR